MPSDPARRLSLIEQLLKLRPDRLPEVESLLQRLQADDDMPATPVAVPAGERFDWPHAPPHRLSTHGTYFVTAGTYQRVHHFAGPDRLDHLQAELLTRTKKDGWQLEAWAVFSNHYHFVAHAHDGAGPLGVVLKELHRTTTIFVNELDAQPGRQVWFNFRDTALTYETSYFARLAYTHNNPVKHRLVSDAREYRWCSAGWYERTATPAQVATLSRIKTDTVNVYDEYEPV
jgi:putative transposase